jgi:hypothetical protein
MLSKIDAAKGEEKIALKRALNLGLNAFEGEVDYDEN